MDHAMEDYVEKQKLIAEEKGKIEKDTKGGQNSKWITSDDIRKAFLEGRKQTSEFVDKKFIKGLGVILQAMYGEEPKDWAPLQKAWQDYNIVLNEFYFKTTIDLLAIHEGEKIQSVELPMEKVEKKKTKKKKTPKTRARE